MERKKLSLFISCLLICVSICQHVSAESSAPYLSKGETVYVPIYSHIYIGDREYPFLLAATLSVRNIDLKFPIVLLSADYYDSKGKLLKKFVEKPVKINPISSERYVIMESDMSGGSGASFIVKWKSEQEMNAPIIESIMIGTRSQQGISFSSRGKAIYEHNEK